MIPYAKTAKKMDVKRLKTETWNLLTDGQKTETVTEVSAGEPDTSIGLRLREPPAGNHV